MPCGPSPPPCLLRFLLLGVKVSKKMNKKSNKKQAQIHKQFLKCRQMSVNVVKIPVNVVKMRVDVVECCQIVLDRIRISLHRSILTWPLTLSFEIQPDSQNKFKTLKIRSRPSHPGGTRVALSGAAVVCIQLPRGPSPPPCLLRFLLLGVKVSKKMNQKGNNKTSENP